MRSAWGDGGKSARSMEVLELEGIMTAVEWRIAKFGVANSMWDSFI